MGELIKVLIIEDSVDDAELMERGLRRFGLDVRVRRVESAAETRCALLDGEWDIVVADYSLPGFRGVEAIAILKELGLDVPLVVVSGVIDVPTAVETMKAGAADYLLKDDIDCLPAVVRREIEAAASRRYADDAKGP